MRTRPIIYALMLATASMAALSGIADSAGSGDSLLRQFSFRTGDPTVSTISPVAKKTAARIVMEDGFLYEDFESASGEEPNPLPEGWTVLNNSGNPDDVWKCGTLTMGGEILKGKSGSQYMFLLPAENQHDCWAFTPKVHLLAGKEYKVEFYVIMPMKKDVAEHLVVKAGTKASPADMTIDVADTQESSEKWTRVSGKFTTGETGDYCLGFHSISPAGGDGTVIDNVKIWTGEYPVFYGYTSIDFGNVETLEPAVTQVYEITNYGLVDMNVSLKECSPEISVEGLPVKVNAYDYSEMKVSLDVNTEGPYEGYIILNTDDPTLREAKIKVTANVKKSRVTDYNYEDFEQGGPEGWTWNTGAGNVSNRGMESPRCWWTTSFYSLMTSDGTVGFNTHFVNTGGNPEFSFWYRLTKKGDASTPIQPEIPRIVVSVSDDYGVTYTPVYTIDPENHPHVADTDYHFVSIPLPEHKNKTCRFRVSFAHVAGTSEAMSSPFEISVDNVSMGTPPDVDLSMIALTGPALTDPGKSYTYSAEFKNIGTAVADNCGIEFFDVASGKTIGSVKSESINSGERRKVNFDWTPSESGTTAIGARTFSPADVNKANDNATPLNIAVLPTDNSVISINHGKTRIAMTYPLDFYHPESATQTIFPANELKINKGEINSIVFISEMKSPYDSDSFKIFIGETEKEDFSDTTLVDRSKLTKVFEGPVYFPAGTNDFVIPFNVPFKYNGGNIVIFTEKISNEFVYDKNFRIHECTSPRSIYLSSMEAGKLYSKQPRLNYVYPDIRFNMVIPETGTISGRIKDNNGNAVSGALIKIAGSSFSVVSDSEGIFSFPVAAVGSYKLTAECHGFVRAESDEFEVKSGETVDVPMTIQAISTYSVAGKIVSKACGKSLPGVGISLSGYDNLSAESDADGKFNFQNVRSDVNSYRLRTTSHWFKPMVSDVRVADTDLNLDIKLEEEPLRVANVNVETGNEARISWDKPLAEFRHDSGEMETCIGYTNGWSEIIFGTSFKENVRIKEISWYVTDEEGKHSNFNVFVFGLDAEGKPDPKNILYAAYNVNYVDNGWSTHVLSEPVEADGFMIAVSCTGYMGIGITAPTGEYPFELGTCYYAGDSYNLNISEMATFERCHLMLRAYGDVLDAGAPESPVKPEYKVFRISQEDTDTEWISVGVTDDTTITDAQFAQLASGSFRYAVVAGYPTGETSIPVYSPVIKAGTGGIGSIVFDKDESVAVYSLQGIFIMKADSIDDLKRLPAGIYIIGGRKTMIR